MAIDERMKPEEAAGRMMMLLNGHLVEQALHVVAALGVADLLAKGPRTSNALAEATGTHAASLVRVLRVLASLDVLSEAPEGVFALTAMGETLRSDSANSVRDRAIFLGLPQMWQVWGQMMHSLRTGASAAEHVLGSPFYAYLEQDPAAGGPFNRYMTKTSESDNAAIVASYDFSTLRTLVDIGGGHGATLAAILRSAPGLRGVLFDRANVVAGATLLAELGMADRCTVAGGDMLAGVPPGADGYMVKRILMDRSDEAAIHVLRNCRAVMAEGGRVLAVEPVMPPDNRPGFNRVLDLSMLLLFGTGRIRTESEFRSLFAAAGLRVARCLPTASPNMIIEAVAA